MRSPNFISTVGHFEYRLDRFFAVGPLLQFGFDQDQSIFVPSLAGRLILPRDIIAKQLGMSGAVGFEVSFLGAGGYVRRDTGLIFEDAGFTFGSIVDMWVNNSIFFGLGYLFNITGSPVDDNFHNVFLSFGVGL